MEEARTIYTSHVSRLFGINHCEEHTPLADHVIYSYLNKTQAVRIRETYTHPKLQPLFDILRSGISIRRSNGQLDSDWKLKDDPYDSPNLIRKQNNEWRCPMHKIMEDQMISKAIPLHTLFDDMDPDSEYRKCLATALRALSDGIYSGN
jgi:hypothetical protein